MAVSLEAVEELGLQVAAPDRMGDVLAKLMLEDLVWRLDVVRPGYGRIFRMLYEGLNVAEIARRCGRPRKTMEYQVKKVREEARKWVKKGDLGG